MGLLRGQAGLVQSLRQRRDGRTAGVDKRLAVRQVFYRITHDRHLAGSENVCSSGCGLGAARHDQIQIVFDVPNGRVDLGECKS